jgi:hypothetical protein
MFKDDFEALQRATTCLPRRANAAGREAAQSALGEGIAVHTGTGVRRFTGLLIRKALAYILHDSIRTSPLRKSIFGNFEPVSADQLLGGGWCPIHVHAQWNLLSCSVTPARSVAA